MDESEHRHAEHCPPSGSDDADNEGQFQPRAKWRIKLEKLAQWRIDPSLIKLSTDGPDFVGGHAAVSAGFLARPPGNRNSTGRPEDTVDGEKEQVEGGNHLLTDDHDAERERQGLMPEAEETAPVLKVGQT
ncbi:hypothetical protein FS837_012778 [Tulasnella sp. UAMH 9824]|nr:hypothetical protein FS837_012778 [Tulasnella sp. UAMH 9824]